MIKEDFPQILGKGGFNACKDRSKLGLERLDGKFRDIAAMDIRRDELELDVPFLIDDAPVVSTGFVVEDFKFDAMATGFQAFHN